MEARSRIQGRPRAPARDRRGTAVEGGDCCSCSGKCDGLAMQIHAVPQRQGAVVEGRRLLQDACWPLQPLAMWPTSGLCRAGVVGDFPVVTG